MAPPKERVSTLQMKKPCTKPTSTPIQEETLRVEASDPIKFPREYVPPRKPRTNQFRIPKVTMEGDMLGAIGSLWFSEHDLIDLNKFIELTPKHYLCTSLIPYSLVLTLKT
jgi:hypothetical protein